MTSYSFNFRITRADARSHIKWGVSLVIQMVILNFFWGLCEYVWVSILTLSSLKFESWQKCNSYFTSWLYWYMLLHVQMWVGTSLFVTNAYPLQLYHSPRAKILAFKGGKNKLWLRVCHLSAAVKIWTQYLCLMALFIECTQDCEWVGFSVLSVA